MEKSDRLQWANADFYLLMLFAFSVFFSVSIVQGAMLLLLAMLLVRKYKEAALPALGKELCAHTLFIPWMIYLGVCLLTSLTAYYPLKAFGQLNSDFLKFACLTTLLFSVKKEQLPKLSAVYTAAATIAALFGIYYVGKSIAAGDLEISRANGYMNAVRYAETLTIALTLVLSRLVIPSPESFRGERTLYKLAVLPIFISIVFTQTRGAYLGLVTGIAVMIYFASPSRKKVMAYAAVMLVTAILVMQLDPSIRDRFSGERRNPAVGQYSSVNIRLELWQLGVTMFKAHPILGVGPDNVKPVFKKFHPGPIAYEETWGSLHNIYVHQAAERGLLGLFALLNLFTAMLLFALKRFKAVRSPYTLWALCALPAYYVMNFTEITFQHVHTSFAIFLAIAFAAAVRE